MEMVDVAEVWHAEQEHAILYHNACYSPFARKDDIKVQLCNVPDAPIGYLHFWIDPGCAVCGKGLAVRAEDEAIEQDMMKTVDELEKGMYSIYVDELFTMMPRTAQAQKNGVIWCHLFTDNPDLEELHQFAQRLGLHREWFQNHPTLPHYDLTKNKRALALRYGAKAVNGEELKAILVQEVRMRREGAS